MADEIKTIDELSGLVAQLRTQHEKALEGVVHTADMEEFKTKVGTDIQGVLEKLETLGNRPPAPSEDELAQLAKASGRAAFAKWMRRGDGSLTPEDIKALATDDDSTGGYLTSPTIASTIIKALTEMSPLRAYASVETIGGNAWVSPKQVGTFSGGWTSERTTRAATANATLGQLSIPLREMYAEPAASQTQLDDSLFDVEGWIAREVAEAFAVTEGTAFISGTGAGQPEGILTNSSVTHVASGAATTITTDGMRRCEFGLKAGYLANAIFLCLRASALELMLLTDGEGQYLWKPDLTSPGQSTFDGYPVVYSPDMPAIGAGTFPVAFGDFKSGYKIVDKATVATLRDPFTAKPNVLFYTTKRVGGGVVQPEAIIKLEIAAS